MSALPQEYPAPEPRPEQRRVAAVRPATIGVDFGLLALRLALGGVFVMHGCQVVLGLFGGPGLAGFATGMAHMGIPVWLGYVGGLAQLLGGLGLFFGVLPRLSALGILAVMVVAVWKVHLPNGFWMNWYVRSGQPAPHGEGYEYHILAAGMALALLLAGPGRFGIMRRG